jgi:hypothetical protein
VPRQALIAIHRIELPERLRGKLPPLAVRTTGHFRCAPEELDRIARETSRASLLVEEATEAQVLLLLRLAAAAPDAQLRFPLVATLDRFLAATAALDANAAQAVSDDALAALWRDAG